MQNNKPLPTALDHARNTSYCPDDIKEQMDGEREEYERQQAWEIKMEMQREMREEES